MIRPPSIRTLALRIRSERRHRRCKSRFSCGSQTSHRSNDHSGKSTQITDCRLALIDHSNKHLRHAIGTDTYWQQTYGSETIGPRVDMPLHRTLFAIAQSASFSITLLYSSPNEGYPIMDRYPKLRGLRRGFYCFCWARDAGDELRIRHQVDPWSATWLERASRRAHSGRSRGPGHRHLGCKGKGESKIGIAHPYARRCPFPLGQHRCFTPRF